jgi:hypothetical protein
MKTSSASASVRERELRDFNLNKKHTAYGHF